MIKTEFMGEKGRGGMKIFTYIEGVTKIFDRFFGGMKYVLEISFILHPTSSNYFMTGP